MCLSVQITLHLGARKLPVAFEWYLYESYAIKTPHFGSSQKSKKNLGLFNLKFVDIHMDIHMKLSTSFTSNELSDCLAPKVKEKVRNPCDIARWQKNAIFRKISKRKFK